MFYDKLFSSLDFMLPRAATWRRCFPKEAMVCAFIVMKCEGFTQITDLMDYLDNNRIIAHYCGFNIMEPLPDGPIMTSFSPSATSRFTSLRTCRSPKYLSTCSSLITVIPAFPYPVLSSVLQRRGQRILCGFPEPHTKTKKQKRRKVNPFT